MQIRKATLLDISALAILFDAYRVFYEKTSDFKSAVRFLTERIERNESEIFVAETETTQIVGFVQLYPLYSSTRMQRLWLLNDLFVLPEFRSKGISIALIEKSKALCLETNACGLQLETAKTNNIGNNLYPKTGFELDTEHHFYFWSAV
ncbi:MAG: GNAT family N-acetyltransferase [Chitinophagales bacterium]